MIGMIIVYGRHILIKFQKEARSNFGMTKPNPTQKNFNFSFQGEI